LSINRPSPMPTCGNLHKELTVELWDKCKEGKIFSGWRHLKLLRVFFKVAF
jgi:hypothetical protein